MAKIILKKAKVALNYVKYFLSYFIGIKISLTFEAASIDLGYFHHNLLLFLFL